MRFAPESIPFAAACVLLAALALGLGGPAWVAGPAAALLFVLYFFRDPRRTPVIEAGAILSPADGRVVEVTRVDDALFGGQGAQRVSIFLSIFNVHVNRSPVEGQVRSVVYSRGRFRAAFHGKASTENERNRIEIATDRGPLVVTQIAGAIARRIVCDVAPGDRVVPGQRLGLIRFGSRVDLFLPLDAELAVARGARVRSCVTKVARLAPAAWAAGKADGNEQALVS